MADAHQEERIRFLQNLRDALQKAEKRGKPALVFVRCVEYGLQENAAEAVEDAFTRIEWARVDLRLDASWHKLQQAAQARPTPRKPRGLLLHALPTTPDGGVERRAVRELARLAPFFLRRGTIAVFVVVPEEAQAIMEDAEALWTSRAGYLAWPQRSQPLSGRNPYGVDEEEDEPGEEPRRPPPPRPGAGGSPLEAASGANLLMAAATLFQNGYVDHAGGHAVQALNSFEAMHDHRGAGEAQHLLAMIAERRHDVSSAVGWYDKALESYRRVKDTELEQAIVLERMGHIHYGRGQYELALTQLRKALELDEKRADERRMAAGFRHLALVLERVDQLPLADTFLRKSHEIEQRLENRAGLARCAIHLGRVGYRLGRFMEANDHLMQALAICEDDDDRSGLSAVLHELGNADLAQGLQPEAIKWYKKAIDVDEQRGDRRALARVHAQLGHAYAEAGHGEKGLLHLLVAHHAANFLGVSVAKQVLSRIHEIRGQLDKNRYQEVVDEASAYEAELERRLEAHADERARAAAARKAAAHEGESAAGGSDEGPASDPAPPEREGFGPGGDPMGAPMPGVAEDRFDEPPPFEQLGIELDLDR